jgi:hypothetical protein
MTRQAAQPAQGVVTFEVSYWAPTRYSIRLDPAEAEAKLRGAGYKAAADIARKIARREITGADASEDDEDGVVGGLASAIAKNAALFGADRPAGEPDDYDDPETYHVWVG